MTVSTQNNFVQYIGDGTTVHFDFNFYCLDTAWLHCFVSNVETLAFTPVVNPDQNTVPGGYVVFTLPPANLAPIEILRETPQTQGTHYVPYSAFPAQSHENALDKLTAEIQDLSGTSTLPDMTGKAGQLLSNNGVSALWEPLVDAMPQPLVVGAVLGTDGVGLLWDPGGGGGGASSVGVPLAAQPNGAAITGFLYQQGIADATNPGILTPGVTPQTVGGVKLFPQGAATNIHDIRDFGAVSVANSYDPSLATVDNAIAIYAAMAAWTQNNLLFALVNPGSLVGGIYIPEGNWYISRPIVLPNGCNLYGDGSLLSVLVVGGGDSTTPSLVQAFSGPMIYVTGPLSPSFRPEAYPTYQAPLVGGVGQAMTLTAFDPVTGIDSPTVWLHDSYPWTVYLQALAAQICLRCWVKIDDMGGQPVCGIIGTRGPDVFNLELRQDTAIGIYARDDGGGIYFRAYLTTVNDDIQFIDSPVVGPGTYNLEIDYSGAFFDFYVDGVNAGHLAATGVLFKAPWEAASIGRQGPEYLAGIPCPNGAIDSIEMLSVAQHTGVGSFTPPATKYAGNANTLMLINFDQPPPPTDQLFLMGQTRCVAGNFSYYNTGSSQPPLTELVPFYMRIVTALQTAANSGNCTIQDLQLACNDNCAGIVLLGGLRTWVRRVATSLTCMYGIKCSDGPSFWCNFENSDISQCWGTGILFLGDASGVKTAGCGIGSQCLIGTLRNGPDASADNSFIPYVLGPGASAFSTIQMSGCANDEESAGYPIQRAAILYLTQGIQCTISTGNLFDTSRLMIPPVVYSGFFGGLINSVHTGDIFIQNPDAPTFCISKQGNFTGGITLINCTTPFNNYNQPISDVDGWITQFTPHQINNQVGLSITEAKANNLTGTFSILHGYTTGRVVFPVPEVDGRYEVVCTTKSYDGSAPAAGSTNVVSYVSSADGFTVTVGADPGGTCQLHFSYHLIRSYGAPLLYEYLPAIPSNYINPFAGQTGDFAVGVTIIPTPNNIFPFIALNYQTIVESGTTPGAANHWELEFNYGNQLAYVLPSLIAARDSFVYNGQLYGLLNPGPHNVVLSKQNTIVTLYVDGGSLTVGGRDLGTQQSLIYLGQRWDGSQTLTGGTLRNFKAAPIPAQVITIEPDAGPGALPVAAFFGDDMTIGSYCTGANGGFATQIADNRFGATYYYLAAAQLAGVTSYSYPVNIVSAYWGPWGGDQLLTGMCILAGFNDLLNGVSAATAWTEYLKILEGVQATATFTPPTLAQSAWVVLVGPSSGSSVMVINGVPFTFTWLGSWAATNADIIAQINASAPTLAVVTPSSWYGQYVQLTAVALGTSGNGIPCTSDGIGGSRFWPTNGTSLGLDTTCIINGTIFLANFDTDAATTINALVADILADAPTAALVTPSNVANQLLITAVNAGSAGNSITVASSNVGGGDWLNIAGNFGTMSNGANGAIPNAIPTILICTVPPFGDAPGYTAGKNTQRILFNSIMSLYAAAHPGDVTLVDVDALLKDGGDPTKIDPIYLSADNINPNDAGHTALYGLIEPLLP